MGRLWARSMRTFTMSCLPLIVAACEPRADVTLDGCQRSADPGGCEKRRSARLVEADLTDARIAHRF